MKTEPINYLEHMKDFMSFFNPKLQELKTKIKKDFSEWYKEEIETNGKEPDDIEERMQKMDKQFLANSKTLQKQSLKDYVDLQLDLFNNNQITKEELAFRTSWINKTNS